MEGQLQQRGAAQDLLRTRATDELERQPQAAPAAARAHRSQQQPRLPSQIGGHHAAAAVVALAAATLGGLLAQIAEQVKVAAAGALSVRLHRARHLQRGVAALRLRLGGVVLQPPPVGRLLKQDAARRLAVAPGAATLLVVRLDRRRRAVVEHLPHVGLVDAHAERHRRDHNLQRVSVQRCDGGVTVV